MAHKMAAGGERVEAGRGTRFFLPGPHGTPPCEAMQLWLCRPMGMQQWRYRAYTRHVCPLLCTLAAPPLPSFVLLYPPGHPPPHSIAAVAAFFYQELLLHMLDTELGMGRHQGTNAHELGLGRHQTEAARTCGACYQPRPSPSPALPCCQSHISLDGRSHTLKQQHKAVAVALCSHANSSLCAWPAVPEG